MIRSAICAAILMSLLESATGSALASPEVVTIINQGGAPTKFIPNNLNWSPTSLDAANRAKKFLTSALNSELNSLKAKGAITVTRHYVSTQNLEYPDWSTYVPVWNQYRLTGWNAAGKKVGTTKLLPTDTPNLADRLVLLNADSCSLQGSGKNNVSQPLCRISNPAPETVLRASLRTYIAFNQEDNTDFYFQQLKTCLELHYDFTIKSGIFDCPKNAAIFGGSRSFPISGPASNHHYSIKVNKNTHTAIWTNSPIDYSTFSSKAKYSGAGVIGFSR
jgi:hypothetical protein